MSSASAFPDVDWPPTAGFWAAAARERLAIPRCTACSELCWYPREICAYCEAREFAWDDLSGRGTLFSWALVERALYRPFATKVPYVTGLVAVVEDPRVRIVTNLVDCDPAALEMEMPVRAVFCAIEFPDAPGSVLAPMFTPEV
jgi:uncharacterized OB-fold protein